MSFLPSRKSNRPPHICFLARSYYYRNENKPIAFACSQRKSTRRFIRRVLSFLHAAFHLGRTKEFLPSSIEALLFINGALFIPEQIRSPAAPGWQCIRMKNKKNAFENRPSCALIDADLRFKTGSAARQCPPGRAGRRWPECSWCGTDRALRAFLPHRGLRLPSDGFSSRSSPQRRWYPG